MLSVYWPLVSLRNSVLAGFTGTILSISHLITRFASSAANWPACTGLRLLQYIATSSTYLNLIRGPNTGARNRAKATGDSGDP